MLAAHVIEARALDARRSPSARERHEMPRAPASGIAGAGEQDDGESALVGEADGRLLAR
jgi:hypothetical protein